VLSKSLATIISWIFHPLFMPLYCLIILFHYDNYFEFSILEEVKAVVFKLVIATTIIFPILATTVFKLSGTIASYSMTTRQERRFPFLLTALFYMFGYYLLRRLSLPTIFYKIMFGATLSITIAVIINLFWKISIHLIGIGGIIGSLLAISQLLTVDIKIPMIISILIAGIIGSTRLSLDEHSPSQIYAGLILGFLCEFGMIWANHI
jgi:hypothetical protein